MPETISLDRLGLQVAGPLANAPENSDYLLVETSKLRCFTVAGYNVFALSEAEAVGAVLMHKLPYASCQSLLLECPRILEDAQCLEVPAVNALGDSVQVISDLDARDPSTMPTYLVVFKDLERGQLNTSSEDDESDRVYQAARTVYEAVGLVLLKNPQLTYDDVLDHMEV